jgi:hypothetical protein
MLKWVKKIEISKEKCDVLIQTEDDFISELSDKKNRELLLQELQFIKDVITGVVIFVIINLALTTGLLIYIFNFVEVRET